MLKQKTNISLKGVISETGTAKASIERAALELFCEGSIESASTKAIALKAGVSEGLLYRHYKSKDDLARALMRKIHIDLTEMIETANDMPLPEAISHIVENYCATADADWSLFRYHILHLHRFAGLMKDYGRSPHKAAAQIIARAQKTGDIKSKTPPDLLAAMALGVVLQTAQAKVLGGIEGNLSQHIKTFERSVLAVLRQD